MVPRRERVVVHPRHVRHPPRRTKNRPRVRAGGEEAMSQRNQRFLALLALLATASPALALYNFGGPDVECYVLAGKPDGLAKGAFYVECTNLVAGGIVGTIFHGNKGREVCHT